MDLKLLYQPQHHFRFFDLSNQPKKVRRILDDYEQTPLVTLDQAIEPLVSIIPQVKSMVELVKNKCQQPKDNLSIDESASIMLYTIEWTPKEDSFYYRLNREFDYDDENDILPWYFYLKLISLSLSKLPSLSNRIFYRGTKLDLMSKYSLNKIFHWYGFSSCSSSIEIFDKDKIYFNQPGLRILFVIHSNHGKNISRHSFYGSNNEMLLPPNQQFKVVSCRRSVELCVIILKEISDSIESISIGNEERKLFDRTFKNRIKKTDEDYPKVNLRRLNLNDIHMDIIVKKVMKKKRCVWLSLQNNYITSHGIEIIAKGLDKNDFLESLYLSQNLVTDTGVQCLTKILSTNYSNLTFLSLDRNHIKDEGAEYLSEMLKTNKTLTDLWLSYNEIGDRGVKSLVHVLTHYNDTLIQLYLDGNKLVSDLSIKSLITLLICNQSLNTLWLQNCTLTQASKTKLEIFRKYRKKVDLYV